MFNEMSSPIFSLRSLVMHPIFLIAVIGIAIRFFIFPFFEVGYDSNFWATIIRNLESGEGLYGLEGYYYSPVWGYILSFLSVLQESFLNIDEMGVRAFDALSVESYSDWFFSATVTSVAFNFWIKVPFMICDLIIGYLIYWIIKDKTQDMRKATIGFALWFLCPLIICATSISGMFDTFSVLFTLLCIVMIRKDKFFLAGVLFSFAFLTKFFPVYLIFLLIAYIIVKHRDDGKALKSVLVAAAGALMAFFVIMAPEIAEGSLSDSLFFITSRASAGSGTTTLVEEIVSNAAVITYLIGIFVSIVLAYMLSKKNKEELDDSFFKYALLMVAFVFIYPPAPQYLVLLIPFLAIYIVTRDRKFRWSWLAISLGGMLFILSGNFVLFMSFGTFTDLMSMDYIMSMIQWFQEPALMGASAMYVIYNAAGIVQYAGILSIIALFLREKYRDGCKGGEPCSFRISLSRFFSCRRTKE